MSAPQPNGDPGDRLPAWGHYPAAIPRWQPVPLRLLSPPGTEPDRIWYALDGWAIPEPFKRVFILTSEQGRQVLFGTVERVGVYTFPDPVGARIVVQTTREVYACFPEADYYQQVQSVRPVELAQVIRALASLPPVPDAPPVS